MFLLRALLCLLGLVVLIVFPLLLVILLVWWLRLRQEPKSTLMGEPEATGAPTGATSAITIPPQAVASPSAPAAATPPATPVAVMPPTVAVAAEEVQFAVSDAPAVRTAAPVEIEIPAAPAEVEPPAAPAEVEPPAAPAEVEAPAAPAEVEPPAAPAKPDDLKRLEGIGPKVAGVLEAAGISTFAQLAETDVARLRAILDAAKLRFLDPTTWPEQAALAAKGDWEAFDKLASELKGGRRVS
ncbi:MAG TPA: DUF4332 domain-containing protein [Anaerolineae bacterium]|nr:DUF4332 domain-containing protein [Anaerolineae bacterium]